jgi:pimeloyl-ACP methyl ester carboxylesterase
LLFIHGTTAQSNTAFDQLPAATLTELGRRYGGRVFALDHFTISVTPHDNIRWLAEQLTALGGGSPLTLDIVSHSRGGLVARVLAERAADIGLAGRVTVRNLVMVAAPNAGTALADKAHLSQLMDRVTDLAQFIPDAGVTDVVGLVLSILKQLTVGAFGGLEGIMAMDPAGEYLKAFNTTPGSTATYRAIASNYQPVRGASLARIARNAGTDFVFKKADNDLVVPTDGVFQLDGVAGFPIADPLVFPAEAGVDHSSYFTRPEVSAKLLEWLPG